MACMVGKLRQVPSPSDHCSVVAGPSCCGGFGPVSKLHRKPLEQLGYTTRFQFLRRFKMWRSRQSNATGCRQLPNNRILRGRIWKSGESARSRPMSYGKLFTAFRRRPSFNNKPNGYGATGCLQCHRPHAKQGWFVDTHSRWILASVCGRIGERSGCSIQLDDYHVPSRNQIMRG